MTTPASTSKTADLERIGVLLGNGIGSYPDTEEQSKIFYERGWSKVSPIYMSKMLPNMAAANVAMALGLVGYNNTVITACAQRERRRSATPRT